MAEKVEPISGAVVRADFNAVEAVLHYTRAAHRLGLWQSERQLIERFFPDKSAPLLEAGCGAGRATLGLWELGYSNLTAFDFAEELVEQARDLAAQRGATAIRFLHADATKRSLRRELLASP
ncbi:MAG TPA: class I SAM-dependent methyltransferase, partial [Opitutaceae bacterium]|nr:class I SAM-dependent methyltransferase [Opitutaceae bacterium]